MHIKIREGLLKAMLNGSREEKFIRNYLREGLRNTKFKVGDSTISILRKYEIDIPVYFENKPVMLIECDGIKFHGESPLRTNTDKIKDELAKSLGYEIKRIKYHSLKQEKQIIVQQCDKIISILKSIQVNA